jgi:trehalose 6-phosphate phosphatase
MSLDTHDIRGAGHASADLEALQGFAVPDLRECAILLDIDGTLLDLAPSPQQVRVPADLRVTLRRLDELTGGALALVSGRSLGDIDRIFSPLALAAIGGHGAEWRTAAGGEITLRADPLDTALKQKLAALSALGQGVLAEDKGYSLALHYRLAPDQADAVHAAIAAICAETEPGTIEILPGKFVVEIKHAGVTKAGAVRELMTLAPFAKRKPIFIGDDITDEPVFGVVAAHGGLGFSVGRVAATVNGRFAQPQSVRAWLARLAAGIDSPRIDRPGIDRSGTDEAE